MQPINQVGNVGIVGAIQRKLTPFILGFNLLDFPTELYRMGFYQCHQVGSLIHPGKDPHCTATISITVAEGHL